MESVDSDSSAVNQFWPGQSFNQASTSSLPDVLADFLKQILACPNTLDFKLLPRHDPIQLAEFDGQFKQTLLRKCGFHTDKLAF